MKNTVKRFLVLLLALTMVFSMTSCDLVFEILDGFLQDGDGGTTGDDEPRAVEVLPDENWRKDPENPYSSLHSGYNVVPASPDGYIWEIENYYEIDRVLDYAIANLLSEITIDFGSMVNGYINVGDFFKNGYLPNASRELEHITGYEYTYTGSVATFTLKYDNETASYKLPKTAEHTYLNYKNGNMLVREAADGESGRSDDFDDFAINKVNEGKMAVYNSESLWWALEHNYLPTFPEKNTKAEAFYEEAKDILRRIINDDMTDYEKTLAIFEYIVDSVDYDYDAFNAIAGGDTANNACYFLEGVFQYNRAVCDGKSKAFVLLCRMEGIECLRDFGASPTGGAGHAWNYVKLDGTWYMVDTTAGDLGVSFKDKGVKAEVVDYGYFLTAVNTYKQGYTDGKVYEYSGIWDSVLRGNDNNASLADEYYDRCELESGKDFKIDSYSELDYLVDAVIDIATELDSPAYTLKFDPASEVTEKNVYEYVDNAIVYENIEFIIYDYTDYGYYMVVFFITQTK